jgi:broad specificity phosphatase PhoE
MSIRVIRHCVTESNLGLTKEQNSRLVPLGKQQAQHLTGHYDLVVCSTLWRTRETLLCSNMTYEQVIYVDEAREEKDENPDNYLEKEEIQPEPLEKTAEKLEKLKQLIVKLSALYPRICLISHGYVLSMLTGYRFQNGYWMDFSLEDWQKLKVRY